MRPARPKRADLVHTKGIRMLEDRNTTDHPSNALRLRVEATRQREGLTQRELAKAIGYAQSTVSLWLGGNYDRDDKALCEAIETWLAEVTARRTPWRPIDIKCALWRLDSSLTQLAREHDFSASAFSAALRKPHAVIERLIAARLGVEPWAIWPDRYDAANQPRTRAGGVS